MNEADIHSTFFAQVGGILAGDGFRRAGPEAFRRPWPGGFDGVVPMTVDAGLGLKLDFSLDIRHDAVEALLAEVDPGSGGPRPDAVTSLSRMGELRHPGGDFHYRLASPAELEAALADFAAYMAVDGREHFRTLRDPRAMERAFNAAPGEPCPHCRNEVRRVLRGLVLAAFYQPGALAGLIEEYRHLYAAHWDPGRLVPRFDAVAGYLARGRG